MTDTCFVEPLDLSAVWATTPPKLDFVLPGLVAGTLGMVVAAGGTGKTFAMLATALSTAIGRDIGDLWGAAIEPGPAVFISMEDPEIVLRYRLHALLPKLTPEERKLACMNLRVFACAGHGLSIVSLQEGEPALTKWFDRIGTYLLENRPRLCVIDTLNRGLGGISEIDAGALGLVIALLEKQARTTNTALVLCHHITKASVATSAANEAHAARGSSVMSDNSRWQVNLSTPTDKDRQFATKTEVERRNFVRLSFSKMNYGPPLGARWLLRGRDGVLEFLSEVSSETPELQTPDANGRAADAVVDLASTGKAKKPKARGQNLASMRLEVA